MPHAHAQHHAHARRTPRPPLIRWVTAPVNASLLVVVVLQLALVWSFRYFPSTDGATHLANAAVLLNYNDPAATEWRQYYVRSGRLDPNLGGHLLLAGLMWIAPPLVAEKLLISLYIVGLPLAFGYALGGVRRDAGQMAILATPFSFTYVLHMGFYNFSLSIAMFFVVLGWWLRMRRQDVAGAILWRGAVLAILTFALYMCHLLSLALVVVAIALLFAWEIGYAAWMRQWRLGAFWRPLVLRAIVTALAAAPTLALAAAFLRRHRDPYMPGRKWELLAQLFSLESLASFRDVELWVTRALSAMLILGALYALWRKWAQRRIDWSDGLLLLVPAMTLLYLKAGVQVYLPSRLGLYVFLCLALWLGAQELGRARWLLAGGSAAIAIAMLGLFVPMYARLSAQLAEFMSVAPHIQPNSTLLTLAEIRTDPAGHDTGARLGWAPGGSINQSIHAFCYAQGYLVPDLRLVDLRNYEADMGYFPVDYRLAMNPYRVLPVPYAVLPAKFGKKPPPLKIGLEWWPAPVNLRAYEQAGTDGSVDYVLLWGKPDQMQGPQADLLYQQLAADYSLIYTSPNRLARLYQRRAFGP